ncbi:MAG: thymidine phosphorylase, partial [Bdellovibrionota bacterium]
MLIPGELIKKKRNGGVHSFDELKFLVDSYTTGALPDYQMAAWLMSVYFAGMTPAETAAYTEVMLHSGRVLDFSRLGLAVDKHSTGGVGAKTSMILAPLVAAAGVPVPMIAGRGLGHTGGTLDKLESIPGFSVGLTLDQFERQVEKIGVAIIGQTAEICPADKKIYALRDVTATVESYPLICGSIMSKKLAEGIGALVLDVKFGNGAFMKTLGHADELASKLIEIGAAHGKRVAALLTSVNEPLGRFVGNSLEIAECVAIMKGESFGGHAPNAFADTRELTLALAGHMIWLGKKASSANEGVAIARKLLESGHAFAKFEEMCRAQGGRLAELPMAKNRAEVLASADGFVSEFDTEKIGYAALALGAGRAKASDQVDPTAGLEIHRKLGDEVRKGERMVTLHFDGSSSDPKVENVRARVSSALSISLQKPRRPDLVARIKL